MRNVIQVNSYPTTSARRVPDFLTGGGEMGKAILAKDWSTTPLGPIESWPQSLRTTVSLCLASNFPISLAWGPKRIQIYNDGYWPICGAKHPHSMGQDFKECWFSAWPQVGEAFERAQAGETSYIENQRMFLDRNGYFEETFFTFSFSPIRDESGGVGGLFHPVTETTARMLNERRTRALRDLAARTAKAKTVQESCALAAEVLSDYSFDLPFVLLYVLNDDATVARLKGVTGLQPKIPECLGLVDVVSSNGEYKTMWPLSQVMRTGQAELVRNLGDLVGLDSCGPYPEAPQAAVVLPIPRPGVNRPGGLLVAGVSARLPLDDVYRGFYDLLVGHLAASMANARAYEEERAKAEALAELDRAKTVFFSNVSHEFRTPLTLILSPLQHLIADSGSLPEGHRTELELAHHNALRLLKLVNTLLDFSRVEAGRVQALFEPIDLGQLTADLASAFRSAMERAHLQLVVDCPALPEPVYVDREMWEKIVLNLVSNAFKFTFEGQVSVSLKAIKDHVELVVQDTGTGIDETELPRIFERFHRIQGARARTHEGTGIGLALIQELVRLHGGSVSATSRPNQGSTFTVVIPLGNAHLPSDRTRVAGDLTSTAIGAGPFVEEALRWIPSEAHQSDKFRSSLEPSAQNDRTSILRVRPAQRCAPSGCILLADDNADMRDYIRGLLSQHYEVQAVGDGEAALAIVQQGKIDLVLTDIMMPRLDGFGLLQQLRQDRRTSTVPVILLSARAGEESQVEGLEAGADDYLVKPFTARELLARVDAHLRLSKLRREAATVHESELRFRSMADCAPVLMWTCGADGRADYFDRGWLDFTGWSLEQAANGWTDVVHPEDLEGFLGAFHAGLSEQRSFVLEYRLRRRDGQYRWMLGTGAPRCLGNGQCVGYISSCIDISERKQAENEVRELNETLEQRVAARTEELARVNRDLEAFSYSVSHDLRAPLRHINGFASILAEECSAHLGESGRSNLELIQHAARKMSQLIDALLEMGRIDRREITFRITDLSSVLQEVLDELAPERSARKIDWRINPLPTLSCDPALMKSVFTNLLSNAIKYTKYKECAIIEIGQEKRDGTTAIFVRDNGAGFDQKYAHKLFGVFQRLHRGDEFEGTGVGLATVQRILRKHGGDIWAKGEVDQGATFFFTVASPIQAGTHMAYGGR